jgi:hypothetical protein
MTSAAIRRPWNEIDCFLVQIALYYEPNSHRFKLGKIMKSITLHGIDKVLDERIQKKAAELGLSMNKTIKQLLSQSLGISRKTAETDRSEFLDLFGTWSEAEVKEFEEKTGDFEKIHPADWET